MVSPFETAIFKLSEIGFFQFVLPFLLTSAIFYGLLRKSKVFGDPEQNVVVNAIVALTAGMMVWAYPILAGVDIEKQLSAFFFQGIASMLAVVIALLVAGMFFEEDLPKKISGIVKGGKGMGIVIGGGLIVAIVALISSGLGSILLPNFGAYGLNVNLGGGGLGYIDQSTILSIVVVGVMGLIVVGIVWGGGGKKQ